MSEEVRDEIVEGLLQERFRMERQKPADSLTWLRLLDALVYLVDPERLSYEDVER